MIIDELNEDLDNLQKKLQLKNNEIENLLTVKILKFRKMKFKPRQFLKILKIIKIKF